MNRVVAFVTFLAAGVPCIAAELVLPLNELTVNRWSLSGALPSELGREPLSLPAEAQLQRDFSADRVSLEIVARPVFSTAPEDWTLVELGSSALVLARDGQRAAAVLLADDGEPVVRYVSGDLGPDGRPVEPVRIVFGRHESGVFLEVGGGRVEVPKPHEPAVRVVLSSGRNVRLDLDRTVVTLAVAEGGFGQSLLDEAAAATARDVLSSGADDAGKGGATGRGTHGESDPAGEPVRPLAITAYRPLEIASPPSVRGVHAPRIEAAVKALNQR